MRPSIAGPSPRPSRARPGRRPPGRLAIATAVLLLGGCAGLPGPRVDWTAESCCADLGAYETFALTMEGLPGFLEPYFYTEVVPVMQERGLRFLYASEAEMPADLVVWLAYEQVDLEDARDGPDEGSTVYGIAEPVRFLARVRVELVDAESGATVASGLLARIHNAPTGGYMHEARAREAIRTAFAELVDALSEG